MTLISAGLIFLICLIHKDFPIRQGMLGKEIVGVRKAGENQVLAVLFFISLLSVFRILSWQLLLLIVLVSCIGIKAFCKEKYLPLEADFGLLLTFLASLISYKFFAAESEQTPAAGTRGRYMLTFTIWNVGMALVLLAAAFLFTGLT